MSGYSACNTKENPKVDNRVLDEAVHICVLMLILVTVLSHLDSIVGGGHNYAKPHRCQLF